jgi:hypothetical protein
MRYPRTTCKGCRKAIIWVRVQCPKCSGAGAGCAHCRERGVTRVPLDAVAPVFRVATDVERLEHEEMPLAEIQTGDPRRVYVSHFATCTAREQFSRSSHKKVD